MKISVIGAGKWGQALFRAFSEKNYCVITSPRKRDIEGFTDLKTALSADILVFALATQGVGGWLFEHVNNKNANFLESNKFNINKQQKILIASKGIEASSGRFLNEIFEQYCEKDNIAYLSGPSFASEVIQGLPCAIVVNSTNIDTANTIASFFPDYMKAYSCTDIIGAEICGAYKNVIAIASGICDGLNLGNNARASLIARGLVEMERFGRQFGAKSETFFGLSGAGDLFLTASSKLSRNYRVGYYLSEGKSIEDILKELQEVAEGIITSKAIVNLSKKMNIYTPIASEICQIIDGKDIKLSLDSLLKKR